MSGTLAIHSLESFLGTPELEQASCAMEETVVARRHELNSRKRKTSVHAIEGLSVEQTLAIYEPQGRLELVTIPPRVRELLDQATSRNLAQINRVFPLVTRADSWFYVEYSSGQFIAPHIDYPVDDNEPSIVKYAAISVTLEQSKVGGEFFVCTSSDDRLWQGERRTPDVTSRLDWFDDLKSTRWMAHPRPGDALCWGTEMLHGTQAVVSGTAKKLIGLLY